MSRYYRSLLMACLVLASIVVTLGAYVRLSDAGLGCPDWPGCYGKWIGVPDEAHEVVAAESAFPNAPVEVPKAWKEMIHRYAASLLGLGILGLAAAAWSRNRTEAVWTRLLVVLVLIQGALGMWTVTLLLKPVIVTLHLIGGLTVLSILLGLTWRAWVPPSTRTMPAGLAAPAWLMVAIVAFQISLGGWTSSNYAAMACPDYPQCQQAWVPEMDWSHAFVFQRELGQTASGEGLPIAALVAIHWTHRWFAMVVVACALWLAWRLIRAHAALKPYALALVGAVGLQWGIGVLNVYLQWPLGLAVLHNTGAALLLAVALVIALRLSGAGASATQTLEAVAPSKG